MIRFVRLVALLLVGFTAVGAAAARWTVDLKSLGVPGPPRLVPEFTDRTLKIGFSAFNEVLVSFVLYRNIGQLETRQSTGSRVRLVALLLDATTGKLMRRQEWTMEAPPLPTIARLPGGGFVAVFGDRLQVLDDSFMLLREKTFDLREKTLDLRWADRKWFDFIIPVKGNLFGIEYFTLRPDSVVTQIIDSRTLMLADEWETPGHEWSGMELYGDYVLVGGRGSPRLKQIGREWHDFGGNLVLKAREVYQLSPELFLGVNGRCWFETNGAAVLGKPVCYSEPFRTGARAMQSSQDGSILAIGVGGPPSGFAALLDRNGQSRVIVYAQGTHRELLTVPPSREGGGFALSLDGSLLAVLRGEKLSLYTVPHP